MHIRSFRKEDLPYLLNIYAKSKLDELRFEQKSFEFLPLDQDVRRWKKFEESEKYVYENSEGQILAYTAHFNSEIRHLFVLSNERGKGIGKSLLKFLLAKLDVPVNLYISKSNIPARDLYCSFGFKVIREFESDYNGQVVVVNEMSIESDFYRLM